MSVDVFNSSNYLSFNVTAANVLGLDVAVYCAELMSVYGRESQSSDDGFIELDRKAIESRTTLSAKSQATCDDLLCELRIVERNGDSIRFDSSKFRDVLIATNTTSVRKLVKKKKSYADAKRGAIAKALKSNVDVEDESIRKSMERWIDALMSTNKLSTESVTQFQTVLTKYAGKDVAVAIDVLNVAIAQKYVNCVWAIDAYERQKTLTRGTRIKVATSETLSDKKY